MAGNYKIEIDMGTDFMLPIRYTLNGSPVNISSATFAGGLLPFDSTTITENFSFTVLSGVNGQFMASLSDTVTASLPNTANRYYVDITISGITTRLLHGAVKLVKPGGP